MCSSTLVAHTPYPRKGHANPAFTLSVYQHLLPGMQADAAKAFAAAVFG